MLNIFLLIRVFAFPVCIAILVLLSSVVLLGWYNHEGFGPPALTPEQIHSYGNRLTTMYTASSSQCPVTDWTDRATAVDDPSSLPSDPIQLRVNVPEFSVSQLITCSRLDTVAAVRQQCLTFLAKEVKYAFNYGMFLPAQNNRAGKFLDDARPMADYPFSEETGLLELKYKRRVYKMMKLDEKLLKSVNSRSNLTRFIGYVTSGQLERVSRMCGRGLDPNFYSDSGETPLTLAAGQTGSCQMITTLLNGGAILDFRNQRGATAVHQAIKNNNHDSLKTLLGLGASPNYLDCSGLSPLYYSLVFNSDLRITKTLLYEHAVIGARDDKGWAEVHQATRGSLTEQLEQLLLYGADPDVRNASGNTALHVCGVNDERACALLLLRSGASSLVLNFANQTAYQVAVIAGNLSLADLICQYQPDHTVKFKETPAYNPRRRSLLISSMVSPRAPLSRSESLISTSSTNLSSSASAVSCNLRRLNKHVVGLSRIVGGADTNVGGLNRGLGGANSNVGGDIYEPFVVSVGGVNGVDATGSPSLSDRSTVRSSRASISSSAASDLSNVTATAAAAIRNMGRSAGDAANRVTADAGADLLDVVSDSSGFGSGSGSGDSVTPECFVSMAGSAGGIKLAVCMLAYQSSVPGSLALQPGDVVEVSSASEDGMLQGRRAGDASAKIGVFPSHCVAPVRLRRPPTTDPTVTSSVPRAHSFRAPGCAAPAASDECPVGGAPWRLLSSVRTVTLTRDRHGFGFVLRGAKAGSPLLRLSPSVQCPSLQYLDRVEPGDVAHRAGLRRSDFVLAINGVEVSRESHEIVVEMIRQSGDCVTLTVAAASAPNREPQCSAGPHSACRSSYVPGYASLPRRLTGLSADAEARSASRASGSSSSGAAPPPPPPRDPRTSLSVGRARARSVADAMLSFDRQMGAIYGNSSVFDSVFGGDDAPGCRAAPGKGRKTLGRPSSRELQSMFSRLGSRPSLTQSAANSAPRVYASVAEMKRNKGKRGHVSPLAVDDQLTCDRSLSRSSVPRAFTFGSTPDLLRQLVAPSAPRPSNWPPSPDRSDPRERMAFRSPGLWRSHEHLPPPAAAAAHRHSLMTPAVAAAGPPPVVYVESSFRPNSEAKLYDVPSTAPTGSTLARSRRDTRQAPSSTPPPSVDLLPPPPPSMMTPTDGASDIHRTQLAHELRLFSKQWQGRPVTISIDQANNSSSSNEPPYVTRISTDSTRQQQQQQLSGTAPVLDAVVGEEEHSLPLPAPPLQFRDCVEPLV